MTEKVFAREEIVEKLRHLPGWSYNGKEIVGSFDFEKFTDAIKFVNQVALRSEDAKHHPDILIQYNRVQLRLKHHSANGITQKDLDLAFEINSLLE